MGQQDNFVGLELIENNSPERKSHYEIPQDISAKIAKLEENLSSVDTKKDMSEDQQELNFLKSVLANRNKRSNLLEL
jgi:hypothetical protein